MWQLTSRQISVCHALLLTVCSLGPLSGLEKTHTCQIIFVLGTFRVAGLEECGGMGDEYAAQAR